MRSFQSYLKYNLLKNDNFILCNAYRPKKWTRRLEFKSGRDSLHFIYH